MRQHVVRREDVAARGLGPAFLFRHPKFWIFGDGARCGHTGGRWGERRKAGTGL